MGVVHAHGWVVIDCRVPQESVIGIVSTMGTKKSISYKMISHGSWYRQIESEKERERKSNSQVERGRQRKRNSPVKRKKKKRDASERQKDRDRRRVCVDVAEWKQA